MPYMSPAAIGWIDVRFAGDDVFRKRSPMAARTASGQPRPDDDDTVMTTSSGISSAASAALRTGAVRMAILSRWCGGIWWAGAGSRRFLELRGVWAARSQPQG